MCRYCYYHSGNSNNTDSYIKMAHTTGLINIVPATKIEDIYKEQLGQPHEDIYIVNIKVLWKLMYDISDSALEINSGSMETCILKIEIFDNNTNESRFANIDLNDYQKEIEISSCKRFTIQSVEINFKTKTIKAIV